MNPVRSATATDVRTTAPAGVRIARFWGVAGVVATLAQPAWSLGVFGWEHTFGAGLAALEWVVFGVIVALFAYGEGWRALSLRWAPFALRRIKKLDDRSNPLLLLLAPVYAMGLITSDRKLLLSAWGGTAAIFLAVLLVWVTPQPWRGMIDVGVSAALSMGVIALVRGYLTDPEFSEP